MSAAKELQTHDAQISSNGRAAYSTAVADPLHLAGPYLPGSDDDPSVHPPPRWWQIRGHYVTTARAAKSAQVAPAGGESLRWSVNPIPLLALVVSVVLLLGYLFTAGWNLRDELTSTKYELKAANDRIAALQKNEADLAPKLVDMAAYQNKIINWQADYDGKQKAAETSKMDEMIKLLKGKHK